MPSPASSDILTGTLGPSSDGSISGDLTDTMGSLTDGLSGDGDSPLESLIAGLTDGSTSSGLDEKLPALIQNINDLASGAGTGLEDGTSVVDILSSATNGLPDGLGITLNGVTDGLSSDDPVNGVLNHVTGEVAIVFSCMKKIANSRTLEMSMYFRYIL